MKKLLFLLLAACTLGACHSSEDVLDDPATIITSYEIDAHGFMPTGPTWVSGIFGCDTVCESVMMIASQIYTYHYADGAEGPSAENLSKGKEFFLKNHNENLRENSYWATALETYLDTKVDITCDFEQTLQSITADDARRAIEQLLEQQNHTEVIMVGVAE